ncbi:unnamed protein product, partial [Adineta ricciae]
MNYLLFYSLSIWIVLNGGGARQTTNDHKPTNDLVISELYDPLTNQWTISG